MSKLFVTLSAFGLGGAEFGLIFVVLVIALVPMILYLISLQKAMEQVSPDLRRMSPGQVWLLLIPVFGLIWNFIMIGHIADSLAAEFGRRNIPLRERRPGYSVGLAMSILQACGIIPFIGSMASLGGLVCWIIYWVKISGFRRELEANPSYFPQGIPQNSQQYAQFGQQQQPPSNHPGQNYPGQQQPPFGQ